MLLQMALFCSFAKSCPTLSTPPGFSVHGILQARILEWISMPFSRESSQPRDGIQVSCIAGRFFAVWATREAIYRCVCIHTHTHTHTHTHIHTLYMFLYTYTVYVCVYICMCICIYIYTVEYYSAMTPDSLTRERDEAASRSLGRFSWWENCYLSCGHKALSNQKWRAAWM